MAPLKWKIIVGIGQLAFHLSPNSSNLAQPQKAKCTYFKHSSLRWLPPGWPFRTFFPSKLGPSLWGPKATSVAFGRELPVKSPSPSFLGRIFYFILFIYIYLRGLETNFFPPLFRTFWNFFIGN